MPGSLRGEDEAPLTPGRLRGEEEETAPMCGIKGLDEVLSLKLCCCCWWWSEEEGRCSAGTLRGRREVGALADAAASLSRSAA